MILNFDKLTKLAFCFFLSFFFISISPTQLFLALALLFWFLSVVLQRKTAVHSHAVSPYQRVDRQKAQNSLFLFYLIYLLYVLWRLSQAAHSTQPSLEIFNAREVGLILVLPLTMYVFQRSDDKFLRQVILFMLIVPCSLTLFQLIDFLTNEAFSIGTRFTFLGQHPLTFGGILGLFFFLSIGISYNNWMQKQQFSKTFLALSSMFLLGIVFNQSRGVLLAVVFTLFIFFALRIGPWNIIILPITLLFSLFFIKTSNWFNLLVLEQLRYAFYHQTSFAQRVDIWLTGLNITSDYFLLGTGAADYREIYFRYLVDGAVHVAALGSHMHNDYLDMLVLYGIPGYLFLCCFYFMPIVHFFKFQHIAKENQLFHVGLGAVMAIICLSFMSLSQCHFSDEEVQMIFWVAVGLIYHSISNLGSTIRNSA